MNELHKLYAKLSDAKLFENMTECEECEYKCKGTLRERFLLKEEAIKLKKYFPKIVNIDDSLFFDENECPHLNNGKCSIYDIRPLECRITPVKFLSKDDSLYWIITRPCKLTETSDSSRLKMVKELANIYVNKIEPYFTAGMWTELNAAARAINRFDPYQEGKDCIVLRKAGYPFSI